MLNERMLLVLFSPLMKCMGVQNIDNLDLDLLLSSAYR